MAAPEKSRRSFLKHALLLSGATTLPTIWSKAEPPSGTLPAPAQGGEGAGIYGLTTLKQDDITNTGLVNNYGYNQELCKHYTCLRATGAVPIDGEVDNPVWKSVPKSPRFVDMTTGNSAILDTRAAVQWDDENLYVAYWIQEPNIAATLTRRDSLIWNDNDVEMFIAGEDCYYEFEINAFGTVYEVLWVWQDAYKHGSRFEIPELDLLTQKVEVLGGEFDGRKHPRGGRWGFREWDLKGLKTAVKVNGTANKSEDVDAGWNVEIAIPWSGLKLLAGERSLPPKPGDVWRMDFSRFELLKERGASINPGWSWNTHGVYDSHIPELFTYIHFSDKTAGEINS